MSKKWILGDQAALEADWRLRGAVAAIEGVGEQTLVTMRWTDGNGSSSHRPRRDAASRAGSFVICLPLFLFPWPLA